MTSSKGNIFRVTGSLRGESTGHRWIPLADSPGKGQWREALIISLNCWTKGWANNRDAGDLRRHRAHYDVTVMRKFRRRAFIQSIMLPYVNLTLMYNLWSKLNRNRNISFQEHESENVGYKISAILFRTQFVITFIGCETINRKYTHICRRQDSLTCRVKSYWYLVNYKCISKWCHHWFR